MKTKIEKANTKSASLQETIWSIGALIILAALFLGVPMITTNVMGANITNESAVAKVFVWNTGPNITLVVVNPSPIDLTPDNTTEVNCTAFVWDWNGWQDVKNVTAHLYDITEGDGTTPDNNYRYINDSCGNATTACMEIDDTNASCTCTFDVWYYANNGTWQCSMNITDAGGNATSNQYNFNDTEKSSYVTVNPVLALKTTDEIDYGNLSVTETSDNMTVNITNVGNVPLNLSVKSYGGTNDSITNNNVSMICQYGNITWGYQRYSSDITAQYAAMLNVTNVSTSVPYSDIPVRVNDATLGNSTNTTYWRIQIPLTVAGFCNGTIEFLAVDTSINASG